MKEFKQVEKARILAMAKNQFNMFIVKRKKLEAKLAVAAEGFGFEAKEAELKKKYEEALDKLRQQFEAKTQKLRDDIAANKEEQKSWTPAAIASMLEDHDIEELIDFSYETDDSGKRRLQATFKYPTVLPPTDENEATALGINEPETTELPLPEEEPVTVADDVPANDEEPEYDSAGFSAADGLREGEPAELAETVAAEEAAAATTEQITEDTQIVEQSEIPVADEAEAVEALEEQEDEDPWDDGEAEAEETDENPFGTF